jgi:nucleoid-associated protein YgaU/DNA-binding SARP family transcriptional activator
MRAVGRALRGVGAIAALLILLVGVPAFLAVAVGWPLPRVVPAWEQITETFRGDLPLDAGTVWKVLACVVWVAWAQVFAATAVEAMALARGGVAAPIRGLAHMQGLAGSLLGTAVLLLPGTFAQAPAHEGPSIAAARTLVAHTSIPAASSAGAYDDDVPALAPEAALIEHTVVRRDTLWDLAERYVAPGGSVDEISSAVRHLFELNQGRPQPDGSALTDASLLRPGWVLRIPVSTPPPPGAPAVAVAPGDSLWEIAEEHLGDGHRYREVFDLNVGRPQPDGDTLTDPSLIEPGWTLALPGAPAPPAAPVAPPTAEPAVPPTTEPTAPPTTAPPPSPPSTTLPAASQREGAVSMQPASPAGSGEERSDTEPADDQVSTPDSPLGIAGGLLATGVAAAVSVRRRRQRMRRTPGTELPPLPDDAAGVVDAIAKADLDVALGVDHALRGLGRALASRDQVPVPVVATVSAKRLELLLDRDCPEPPDGWNVLARGRIWQTKLDASADDPGAGPAWLPTLVSIGALDADGFLLNLEAVGAVGLVGDTAAPAALARSITVELALTPLADVPAVHVVDGVIGDVASLPNVFVHEDLATATEAAVETAAAISGALAGADTDTAAELRCRAPEEAWVPAVVVARATDIDDERQRVLVERCKERAGVVAVFVDGCPPGALQLTVTPETLLIPALDLRCSAQQLDGPTVEVITELLDAADEVATEPFVDGPLTLFTPTELGQVDAAGPKLHLRLLGPMAAEGVELRPQQLAILAYLALHGDVTADALRDAIWGGKTPTRERFLNTIHELRRAVGADVLPTSTDGRYRLRGVWCDAADAERLVAAATEDAENAAVHLRAVLELVAGPPLTYESRHRRHFRWVDLGNHTSRWERVIGDAAHELASIALRDDDVDLARWAAERGLVACPGNETLTGDLVSAYLAVGDHKTAERVVDEYARALEDAGEAEPPDALYELLEGRRAS